MKDALLSFICQLRAVPSDLINKPGISSLIDKQLSLHHPLNLDAPPTSWTVVFLNQIALAVQPGFASGKHNLEGTGIPHLRPMNIDREGKIDLAVVKSVVVKNDIQLENGDILFNNKNSAELIGKTALISAREHGFSFSNHMTKICLEDHLSKSFLAKQIHFLWMSGYFKYRCTHHVNQASISSKTLADTVPLLLPPIREQTRVVEKLEELLSDLDAGVAELKAAQKKLTQYRQSLLKAAVEGVLTAEWRAERAKRGEPLETGAQLLERILTERRRRWEEKQLAKFREQGKTPPKDWRDKYPEPVKPNTADLPELPEGWVWATIDQVAVLVRNGLSQKPNKEPVGYPILRINAVRPMAINLDEVRYLPLIVEDAKDYFIDQGDLLVTRYNGSVELLGVFGLVREVKSPTLHPDKLIRIKLTFQKILSEWVEICAAVGESREHIVSRVKTTAGQTGISGSDIKKMPVPLAPIQEQETTINKFRTVWPEIVRQNEAVDLALKKSSAQRQNILKAAFSGQLVPQDPNDEPASVLLERIRAERAARESGGKRRGRKAKEDTA